MPFSALGYLNSAPGGVALSDELSSVFIAGFTKQKIIAGMHPMAGNFTFKHEDQKYAYEIIQRDRGLDDKTSGILDLYNVSYIFVNWYSGGHSVFWTMDNNRYWDKFYDGDQATIFVSQK